MTDYGHDLLFGLFVPPEVTRHTAVTSLAVRADMLGLDLFAVQDHPYQPTFLDTWTLLSTLASRTSRIRLLPDVASLPLRPPVQLARSVASLDVLSGGRVELGLGAGAFWDGIEAEGGPRRSPGQALHALAEAVEVIRGMWSPVESVRFSGDYYHVNGAAPGPLPAHDIGIWIGGYGPRMLRLIGSLADGWLPSTGYLPLDEVGERSRIIDEAAEESGRDPGAVRRVLNLSEDLSVELLTELALVHGFSGFVQAVSPTSLVAARRFAEEVAPAVREAVARERGAAPVAPAPPDTRPTAPPSDAPITVTGRGNQELLLGIHNNLREEMGNLLDAVAQVSSGPTDIAAVRSQIQRLAMRQNFMSVGAFCSSYCRAVATHHTVEDLWVFPDLRTSEPGLEAVLERLEAEHVSISGLLDELDQALVAMIGEPRRISDVQVAAERLSDSLLSHLAYEEEQLLGPIGRLAVQI